MARLVISLGAGTGGTSPAAMSEAFAPAQPAWTADYDAKLDDLATLSPPWNVVQKPSLTDGGPAQEDRIRVLPPAEVPGVGAQKPAGRAMRVEVRAGDVFNSSGQLASRAEVFARNPPGTFTGTPPEQWPDPVGSERWYGFSVLVPEDFTTTEDHTLWFNLCQWKGLYGGSPPINMEIKRGNFRFGGVRTNQGLIPNDGTVGAIIKGTWTRFVIGVKHSPDPDVGWVEVWRDGTLKLARTHVATMDTYQDGADPTYFKQGIYRHSDWNVTHVLYFGSLKIGRMALSVASPDIYELTSTAVRRTAAS